MRGQVRIEDFAYDDRARLQATGFSSIPPDLFEMSYIFTINLRERRVMIVFRLASVDWPVLAGIFGAFMPEDAVAMVTAHSTPIASRA